MKSLKLAIVAGLALGAVAPAQAINFNQIKDYLVRANASASSFCDRSPLHAAAAITGTFTLAGMLGAYLGSRKNAALTDIKKSLAQFNSIGTATERLPIKNPLLKKALNAAAAEYNKALELPDNQNGNPQKEAARDALLRKLNATFILEGATYGLLLGGVGSLANYALFNRR